MWILNIIILVLFDYSQQACDMYKKTVTIYMTERTLYRYISCTGISPTNNLHNEILSKINSSSQYIEISKSSIPEINQNMFLSLNITELRIQGNNVQIIQENAFENANITSINLENNQIRKIKEGSFKSSYIYVISIQNNSMTDVLASNFIGLKNLRKLNLKYNQIISIQQGSFNDLINLEELNLSFNKLIDIPIDLFKSLKQLQTIYLNDNLLKKIARDSFLNCKVLQYLNIQKNYLIDIDATLYPDSLLFINSSFNQLTSFNFSNLVNVDTIDLNSNKLTNTKDRLKNLPSLKYLYINSISLGLSVLNESFQHLESLNIIEIDNCNIEKFDFKIFNNLENLKGLSLAENNLTSLDFENFITHLNLLNLSYNSIFELNNLSNLTALIKLEVSFNKIEVIKYDMFKSMYNLKNLWMGHNSIKVIELGCFRDLKTLIELNLSFNNILELLPGTFTGLVALIQLDLSHNAITNFDEDIFHSTKHLTFLNIAHNYINNINVKQMISHILWLREINLIGNNWSCISLVNIIRDNKYITLSHGTSYNISNVYGIACNNSDKTVHFDKSEYLIDITKLMNITIDYTRGISYKTSINNVIFSFILLIICAKLVYSKYSSHMVAAKQFIYKKTTSEQEIQLI